MALIAAADSALNAGRFRPDAVRRPYCIPKVKLLPTLE